MVGIISGDILTSFVCSHHLHYTFSTTNYSPGIARSHFGSARSSHLGHRSLVVLCRLDVDLLGFFTHLELCSPDIRLLEV